MSQQPSRGAKLASLLTSILIGVGIIALAGSILMPSTKRAKVDLNELRRMQEEEQAAAMATSLPATTQATTPTAPDASPPQP